MYNDEIQCRSTFYENSFQDMKSVKCKSFSFRNSDVRIVDNLFKKESCIGVRLEKKVHVQKGVNLFKFTGRVNLARLILRIEEGRLALPIIHRLLISVLSSDQFKEIYKVQIVAN